MTEEEARAKIEAALRRLKGDREVPRDTRTTDDSDSVDYHVDAIVKAGGGMWNETIARDYIQNMEAQVGQEVDAPDAS